MAAMTALSIASSAVQFVDFGIKILSKGHEIYASSSGALEENSQLQQAIETFRSREDHLKESLGIHTLVVPNQITSSEANLLELCQNCLSVAKALSERLERLKVTGTDHRKWKSIRQAIKSVWNKKELNAMRDSLVRYKMDLLIYILESLKSEITANNAQQSNDATRLAGDIRQVLNITNATNSATKTGFRTTDDLISKSQTVLEEKIRDICSDIVNKLGESESAVERKRKQAANWNILEGLRFTGMEQRRESISDAEMDTFRWIFEDTPPERADSWPNLSKWLQGNESIYWICGKAGSGKSTLMRYIYEHSTTEVCLKAWAGNLPLLKAGFFFWNSGSIQQRTQIGLLRSLLHQLLSLSPSLIPKIMPQQWKSAYKALQLSDRYRPSSLDEWSVSQLQQFILALAKETVGKFKIALFIDGLDEHHSNHFSLIDLISEMTGFENVKAVVSSRPLIVFEDAYENHCQLKLENLTAKDIKIYVDARLTSNSRYQALLKKEVGNSHDLTENIVWHASGVFMWVKLVVDSLLDGITNRDCISDLKKRLLALPKGLEPIYKHMLNQTDPIYVQQRSHIFQICQVHFDNIATTLSPLDLSFAMDQSSLNILGPPQDMPQKEIEERECQVRFWLRTRCAGLLEIDLRGRVEYVHRSARDYIEKPEVWKEIVSSKDVDFDPHLWIARSIIMMMKYTYRSYYSEFYLSSWQQLRSLITRNKLALHSDTAVALVSQLEKNLSKNLAHWLIEKHHTAPKYDFGLGFLVDSLGDHFIVPSDLNQAIQLIGKKAWKDLSRKKHRQAVVFDNRYSPQIYKVYTYHSFREKKSFRNLYFTSLRANCSLVLEDGSTCPYVGKTYDGIIDHFRGHIWGADWKAQEQEESS